MAIENTVSQKPVTLTRQFNDAADKNVAAVIVFANESNAYFYDEDLTKAVAPKEMLHLFFTGVVLSKEGTFYKAVSCTAAGDVDFGL